MDKGFTSINPPQANDERARIAAIQSIAGAIDNPQLVEEAINDRSCTAERLAYLVLRDRAETASAGKADMSAWESMQK